MTVKFVMCGAKKSPPFKVSLCFVTCSVVMSFETKSFLSGLIIDAFGELRDQQEQVKEDMEVNLKTKWKLNPFRLMMPVVSHSI